jgi:hypothetical protein
MARRYRLISLLAVPGLASCSFLLDFDALQEGGGVAGSGTAATGGSAARAGFGGGGSPAGSGGTSNSGEGGATGATGGTAGSGVTPECPEECFHDDPCLLDGCNTDGSCVTGEVIGLAHDGVDETIPADFQARVTMVGGDDAFFLSSLAVNGDKPEVTFYRLDGTENDFGAIGTIGGLNIGSISDPVSAAGLAVQPITGAVHAFIALNSSDLLGARVWHLLLNVSDPPRPMPVGSVMDGYWPNNPYNYPAAIQIGNQTYAAWLNADQTIGLTDGQMDTVPKRLSAGTPATTLSLVSSVDGQPYVLYTAEGGGVFVERPELAPIPIPECQPAPGNYISSSATFSNLPGFWLSSWTKFADATDSAEGYLTTTGRALLCGPDGCSADMTECGGNSSNNLVRNPAGIVVHRPGDPTGRMEVVQALPAISVEGEAATAWLVLIQQTLTFNPQRPLEDEAVLEEIAPALPLAEHPATPADGFRGPDFPVVAFVPPDRFAVAWSQPAATAGDELRVQRYKMCLPD